MIVALMGMSRHGKDTVGSVFIKNGFKRYAFADKVKDGFCEVNQITREELEKRKSELRDDLIDFAESFKKTDKFYWIKRLEKELEKDITDGKDIVITDVRQIEEILTINKLRELLDGIVEVLLIEVNRPIKNGGVFDNDKNTTAGMQYAHYHGLVDGIIVNNATEEMLIDRTDKMCKALKGGEE